MHYSTKFSRHSSRQSLKRVNSLNTGQRLKQQERIESENLTLANKLINTHSVISYDTQMRDFYKHFESKQRIQRGNLRAVQYSMLNDQMHSTKRSRSVLSQVESQASIKASARKKNKKINNTFRTENMSRNKRSVLNKSLNVQGSLSLNSPRDGGSALKHLQIKDVYAKNVRPIAQQS